MNTPSQNQRKYKVLITGGQGDMALAIKGKLDARYKSYSPDSKELDVTSVDSVHGYFSDKNFDVVINCAGTLYSSLLPDSIPEFWVRDINVNLVGVFLICREAISKNKDVKIINIASTAAFNIYQDWSSYCSSKAAVVSFSGCLLKGGYDIITLCPGAIDTKLRSGLSIENPNIMSLEEGIEPILDAINGRYKSGDMILYRKGGVTSCRIDDFFEQQANIITNVMK